MSSRLSRSHPSSPKPGEPLANSGEARAPPSSLDLARPELRPGWRELRLARSGEARVRLCLIGLGEASPAWGEARAGLRPQPVTSSEEEAGHVKEIEYCWMRGRSIIVDRQRRRRRTTRSKTQGFVRAEIQQSRMRACSAAANRQCQRRRRWDQKPSVS